MIKKILKGLGMSVYQTITFISMFCAVMELSVAVGWSVLEYLIWFLVAFFFWGCSIYAVGTLIEEEEDKERNE